MSKKIYVVWVGRNPGIYESWDECKAQVDGFKGAKFKGYKEMDEAIEALKLGHLASISKGKSIIVKDGTPFIELAEEELVPGHKFNHEYDGKTQSILEKIKDNSTGNS